MMASKGSTDNCKNIKKMLLAAHGANTHLEVESEYRPITDKKDREDKSFIFSPKAEIVILKSCLLAFDALIPSDDRKRFTRSPHLQNVRDFIGSVVMESSQDISLLKDIPLGIQYEKCSTLNNLRDRVDGEKQEFEHVLVASGNIVSGNLDIVWNIFGMEPYGFRVCTTWDEVDFTAIIVNQALKNGKVIGPKWFKSPSDICQYTKRRFMDMHEVGDDDILTIGNIRAGECSKAALKVQLEADEYIWDNLKNYAGAKGRDFVAAIYDMLWALYQNHECDRAIIDRIANGVKDKADVEPTSDLLNDEEKHKQFWLRLYRGSLMEIKRAIGLPNKIGERRIVRQ